MFLCWILQSPNANLQQQSTVLPLSAVLRSPPLLPPLPASSTIPWPEGGRIVEVCGSVWQDAYAARHAQILALDAAQQRILVFDTNGNGGLADRFTGLMTVLLLAILTDRALAIDWPGREAALLTPRIDVAAALGVAQHAARGDSRRLSWLNGNRLQIRNLTEVSDLNAVWPERVLIIQSNRGFTHSLLTSELHATLAASRGLTPANAQFGCLLNFLFEPTAAAMLALAPVRAAITQAAAEGALTVGIHVRTGDASFAAEGAAGVHGGGVESGRSQSRGAELFKTHRFIFDYALRLAAERVGPTSAYPAGRSLRFVILGDSPALRRHAADELGHERVVYYGNGTNTLVAHVRFQPGDATLQAAVSEHWLYTGCELYVFSSHSGFPRTAAARALRADSIHTCFHYQGATFAEKQHGHKRPSRECSGPWSVPALGDRHAAGL